MDDKTIRIEDWELRKIYNKSYQLVHYCKTNALSPMTLGAQTIEVVADNAISSEKWLSDQQVNNHIKHFSTCTRCGNEVPLENLLLMYRHINFMEWAKNL